ncbi:isoprenylcysteine carboxylmethyltransferase family protein [Sphingomonas sp.]|uniref:methyltransferase family protein n=1 Tax=Sphingomonas sp. TaxID=28214 RepID=UPI00333FEFE0
MHFPHDPVGLPGLAALGCGFIAFVVTLLLARRRGVKAPKSADNTRSNASIVWIIVQGIGIGIAGFGPVDASLAAASTKAVIEGFAVLALMLSAVWLFDASSRATGKNWALVARTRSDGTLVQSGPFARIRNPIYVALGCFMLAMAIAYGHTRNLLIAAPLYALGTWMRVRHEEMVLRATFPDYDAYAARVKRFVPGIL